MTGLRNTLAVNDPITELVQFSLLPVGTVMGPLRRTEERYVKTANDMWQSVTSPSRVYGPENFDAGGYNHVISYPEGYSPATAKEESIHEYRWRFRNHMLAAQQRHGVSASAVYAGLRTLGCDDAAMPLGADLPIWNQRDLNRLPVGSLVYTGDPDHVASFAIWQRTSQGTGWLRVEGSATAAQPDAVRFPFVVIGVADEGGMKYDPPAWMSVTDEALTVTIFKARAWLVGMKTKSAESWCGTAESVLHGVGVNAECVVAASVPSGYTIGQEVGPTAARALPLGTVLSASSDTTKYFYQRMENAPVRAGTRRILAFRIDGSAEPVESRTNYAGTMRIEMVPVQGLEAYGDLTDASFDAQLWRENAFDALPPGTIVIYNGSSYYIKAADGRMAGWRQGQRVTERRPVPARGEYRHSDFGMRETRAAQMRVVKIGE